MKKSTHIIRGIKEFPRIKDIKDLKGKRVLLRLDLNVPIKNGRVIDDFRIIKSLPTIKFLKKHGARVVIISHIGRDKKSTLEPVARHLSTYVKVGFIPEQIEEKLQTIINNMKNGTVVVLENVRRDPGEIKNDKVYARKLSLLADVYVNDAFSASHRKHASIVGISKFLPCYIGFLFEEELKHLSATFRPLRPFVFILGGAKLETKIPLIKKYLNIADTVFVGGALANVLLKAGGREIGKSFTGNFSGRVNALLRHKKLLMPSDVLVGRNGKSVVKKVGEILPSDTIVDVGPKTVEALEERIGKARSVLFNGPLGNYETGYDKATAHVLRTIAKSKARSVLGGGDTAYLAMRLRLEKKFTFISTGGGAMIEFLAKGTLPGIKALKKKGDKRKR
ncbi:MAG: phosphoglycerate kinase [Patescibacteria group bacterium]|nr:phosphoglycerate kinase [Patescibacteria group bacterium]